MTEVLDKLLTQTEPIRAPIAGDAPGGIDISLEVEFEKVKGEIDKLTNIAGGAPNWRLVVEESNRLLSKQTKDFRLAVWAVQGAAQTAGWEGVGRQLTVLRSVVTDFWDTSFPPPKREKARANQLTWLFETVTPLIEQMPITLQNGDLVRACDALVSEIDSAVDGKMSSGTYAGLGALRNVMRNAVRSIPEPPPPPPPPPDPSLTPEPAPVDTSYTQTTSSYDGGGGDQLSVATDADSAPSAVKTCAEALGKIAKSLREVELSRVWPYEMVRAAAWGLPDAFVEKGGKLETPPAPGEVRDRILNAMQDGDWRTVINEAEDESVYTPLWLDLQRYTATALDKLGPLYGPARDAVGRSCSGLLLRYPRALDLFFDDGSPTAEPDTKAWFLAEARRWSSGSMDPLASEDWAIEKRSQEARDMVAGGQTEEGLALAALVARRGSDPRARFKGQLALAQLAMTAGSHDVARPILEGLAADVDRHALDSWEPDIAASVFENLVICLRSPAGSAGLEDAVVREAVAFGRLCRISPAGALRSIKST